MQFLYVLFYSFITALFCLFLFLLFPSKLASAMLNAILFAFHNSFYVVEMASERESVPSGNTQA